MPSYTARNIAEDEDVMTLGLANRREVKNYAEEDVASKPAIGLALLATAVCAALLAGLFHYAPSAQMWANLTPGNCPEYCERFTNCELPLHQRPAIQQPLNSWSNLGFVFVGFLAALPRPHPGSLLFGLSCVVLGIGSFLFHASVTYELQWLDVVGMYFVEVSILAWAVHCTWGTPYRRLLPVVVAADLLLAAFKWQLSTTLVLTLLGACIAMFMSKHVRRGRRSLRAAWLPGVLFAIAYVVRGLDVQKVLCTPDSLLFQGHALWHLLCAAAVWKGFQFFTLPPLSIEE